VENSQKGNAINTFIIEGGVTMGWMVELREWEDLAWISEQTPDMMFKTIKIKL